MQIRFKELFKNTGILTISNFTSKILSFLLVPLYTGILSTAEYGQYDLSNTTIQILLPIITFNIIDSVMRFSLERNRNISKVISIGCKFEVIGLLLYASILAINHNWQLFPILDKYVLLSFFLYAGMALNEFFIFVAKGLDRVRDLAISGIIATIVTIVSNILLLVVFPMGISGFYIANFTGPFLAATYIFWRVRFWRFIHLPIDRKLQKEMLIYSAPLILNGLAWKINTVSDRYVVTMMCGVSVNGIYSIAYKIPTIINTIQNIFTQAWQISVYKEHEGQDIEEYYRETFVYINFAMGFICFGLIFCTRLVARILYSNDFFQAWEYVPFLIISSLINTSSGLIGPILLADKKTKPMATSALIGSVTNLVLNFMLVSVMGAQGAAVATAVSSYVIYITRKKAIGNKLNGNSYKKVMLSWLLLIAQVFLMICAVRPLSYLVQLVLFLVFIIIYVDQIQIIVNKLRNSFTHR